VRPALAAAALWLSAAVVTAAPAFAACAPATGFVGTICTPPAPGRHPAVLVLGGSGGGDALAPLAARFAERGYVGASVAYFGLPGLPRALVEIPVETVGTALDAVARRDDVDAARIAVIGDSKGGELALLAASEYPRIAAVIAVVPSPFAWSGADPSRSSWSAGGKPLPFVRLERGMVRSVTGGEAPFSSRSVYAASMRAHRADVDQAMFRLENVRGPILFLAGEDDQVWDSPAQSTLGMEYLRAHAHAYADELVIYPAAGHAFLFATDRRPEVFAERAGRRAEFGGTARGNIDAGKRAWQKIYDFLTGALGGP
jgi:dienelactone hydrolase